MPVASTHLGLSVGPWPIDREVEKTNEAHEWFSLLKCEFHKLLEATKVVDANDDKVSKRLY